MKKFVDLIQLLEEIFGKGAVSRTIGTRTNVVRFPKGKQPIDPTKAELDIEGTAVKNPDLVQTIKNSIEDRMGDITKMNDQELLTYTANVRRLRNFENPPKLPEADVVKFGSGEEMKGEGLEKLIEKQGTRFPPTTDIGKIEAFGKKLEKFVEETSPEYLAKQEAERRAMIARQYEGKGYAGGFFGPSGEYRAVARTFLLDQNAKGKIKLDANTLRNLEERNYLSGGQPLMYADPIRIMRYHYGDDVFEKIPLDKITTGAPSEILDVMSKVEAPPIKTEPPKTPGGYLTPGEYRANIEELKQIEDAIRRREARFADMTEEEIANELAQYGGKRSSFEMGLEFDYPEEYAKYKAPKKPEPSKRGEVVDIVSEGDKRKTIDELIDEYNANFDRTLLTDEEGGTSIGYQEFQKLQKRNEEIAKALEEKGIKSTVEEEIKPEGIVIPFRKKFTKPEPEEKAGGGIIGYTMGGRIGFSSGSNKNDILEKIKKDYDKSITKKLIDMSEKVDDYLNKLGAPKPFPNAIEVKKSQDEINLGKRLLEMKKFKEENKEEKITEEADGGRIGYNKGKRVMSSIDKLLEDMNKKLSKKKSMETVNPKTGEVTIPKKPIRKAEEPTGMTTMDPEPEIIDERAITKTKKKTTQRYDQDIIKAANNIYPNYDDPKIAADQIVDSYAQMKYGLEDQYSLSNKEQMDLYRQAYDYVMDYNRGAIVKTANEFNISDPKTAEAFTNFARENDPEGFKKIQKIVDDINNKNALEEFDIKDREPNSDGGIAGLL